MRIFHMTIKFVGKCEEKSLHQVSNSPDAEICVVFIGLCRGGGGGRGSGHGGGSRGRRCRAATGQCAIGCIVWGSSHGRIARRLWRRRCLRTTFRADLCAVRIPAWRQRQNLRALYFRSGLYRLSPQRCRRKGGRAGTRLSSS